MMVIENKQNGRRFSVTNEEWQEVYCKNIIPGSENPMTGKGKPWSTKFKVVDARTDAQKSSMVPPELRSSAAEANNKIQEDAARKRERASK